MKSSRKMFNVYIRYWTIYGDVGEFKTCYGNSNVVEFTNYEYYYGNEDQLKDAEKCWEFLGTTFATSSKKAISNIRFRLGIDNCYEDDNHRTIKEKQFKAVYK